MPANVKVDSNSTGLRVCEEVSIGVLGAANTQVWTEQEPNSYPDFGGNIETVARTPINAGRQRKKGLPTNVTASAGWNTDLTQTNLQQLLRGFMYSNFRAKQEFTGANTVASPANTYGATGIGTGYFAGDLLFASGYAVAANNGLKRVTTQAANLLTVAETLAAETAPATSKLVAVGFQFASGDAQIVNSGTAFPTLTTTTKDCTQLGLIPGEIVFIGGDAAGERFNTVANNGFARVRSVTTNAITFDKTSATMVTDNGSGKTIRLYKGRCLKNEIGTSIVRRSYTLERTLGYSDTADVTREQAQYVRGGVPNEATITASAASKVEVDLTFVGLDSSTIDENVTGANTLLSKVSGTTRVPVVESDAFNTSSDFSRIRLATVSTTNAFPNPLFTYSEELEITINNNNSPNNALGVLGAFEITAGTFEVGGSITAYFGDVASIAAIRNNTDVTLDVIMVKQNAGVAIDIPLITLGGGIPNVEPDQPVKIPVDVQAATGAKISPNLNHTMFMVFFDYLPNLAD